MDKEYRLSEGVQTYFNNQLSGLWQCSKLPGDLYGLTVLRSTLDGTPFMIARARLKEDRNGLSAFAEWFRKILPKAIVSKCFQEGREIECAFYVPKHYLTEAKIVQTIFETYLEVESYRKTAQKINEMGYRTKCYKSRRGNLHGNKKFTRSSIETILNNPVYIGKRVYKKTNSIFNGRHEAIISEKLWREASERIKHNHKGQVKHRQQNLHTFLLEGVVRCGWCGAYLTPTYSGGRSKTYFYYQCTRANNGADECKMGRVCAEALEEVIAKRIIELSKNKQLLEHIIKEANTSYQHEKENLESQIRLQRKTLLPIEQQIKNIVQFVSQGKKSSSLSEELEQLETQKGEITKEIEKLEREIYELKARTIDVKFVQEGVSFFDQAWQLASEKEKKDLMRLFVYRVIWSPDKIKMGLYPISPIFDSFFPSTVNQKPDFAVDWHNWLPEPRHRQNFSEHLFLRA